MRSLAEMESELAKLQAEVTQKRESVRAEALEGIEQMLSSGTLAAADLLGLLHKLNMAPPIAHQSKRDSRRPPKYRDPESGQTWTGQGAMPNWIKGKNADDYLIKA